MPLTIGPASTVKLRNRESVFHRIASQHPLERLDEIVVCRHQRERQTDGLGGRNIRHEPFATD
jgi:hypothetical protein